MTPTSCLKWKLTGKILKTVVLKWILFERFSKSSTNKVFSVIPTWFQYRYHNLQECIQTLDSSAGTSINIQEEQNLDLSAGTPFNLKKDRIKTWTKDNVISGRPRLYGGGGIPFQLNLDSLPHAYAQTTKTYYKDQDSRIKKAQEIKTKTSVNSNIKDNSSETKLRGRLLESIQEDAKYEHVGQDTRPQGGKDDKDKQGTDLEISKQKTKSKDNDKGSRSKIT
ncbi:hypothetical protein Tco_1561461 [Tanacetum coccineum]